MASDSSVETSSASVSVAEPHRRLRCVHYIERMRLEDGGVVRFVLDICGGLTSRGHEVVLLTADAADVPLAWKQGGPGVPQIITGSVRHRLLTREFLRRAEKILSSADVLHLHGPWDLGNYQLAARARRCGVPYVVQLHGMLDEWSLSQKALKKRIFLRLFGNRFLWGAARVHCAARSELEQTRRLLRPGSAVVVTPIVGLAAWEHLPDGDLAYSEFPQLRRDEPLILFVSRVHPKKGADVLVQAAGKLLKEGLAFHVVIAGPGEPDYVASLQRLAREQGVESRITIPGMVSVELKGALYRACDAFVLPTSQENFGQVLVEALAHEAPVITTRGTGVWRELQEAGAVIVDGTPEAIAAAIKSVVAGDRRPTAADRRRGREYVFQWLAADRLMGQYEAFYRAAISTVKLNSN